MFTRNRDHTILYRLLLFSYVILYYGEIEVIIRIRSYNILLLNQFVLEINQRRSPVSRGVGINLTGIQNFIFRYNFNFNTFSLIPKLYCRLGVGTYLSTVSGCSFMYYYYYT